MNGNRHQWHLAWQLDAAQGVATHIPTALLARFAPLPPGVDPDAQRPQWLAEGWAFARSCALPGDVADRRALARLPLDHPNAPNVHQWAVLFRAEGKGSVVAALTTLKVNLDGSTADAVMSKLQRQAADLWLYRVRLDRERPRG